MSPAVVAPALDPALPTLERALDPAAVTRALAASKHFRDTPVEVLDARLRRHKPGKRAVLDYTLGVVRPGGGVETIPVIAKMRAGRPPRTAFQRAKAVWAHGFHSDSVDGISVPEPLGTVPDLGVWLQRRVDGEPATARLTTGNGAALARRIADAAVKLHRAGVPTERIHTAADELAILVRVLSPLTDTRPDLAAGIRALLSLCARVTASLADDGTGIHRDFYADQVIVDGERIHLIDFDLYCHGPAALDVGNFAGHLAEQAVREPGHADALVSAEQALEDRYVHHAGASTRADVRAYAALTLARHVYLSTVIPGRLATTGVVLSAALARTKAVVDGR